MAVLHGHVATFRDFQETNGSMTKSKYRQLLGVIGDTFIGDRLFCCICKPGSATFDINDYLIY